MDLLLVDKRLVSDMLLDRAVEDRGMAVELEYIRVSELESDTPNVEAQGMVEVLTGGELVAHVVQPEVQGGVLQE